MPSTPKTFIIFSFSSSIKLFTSLINSSLFFITISIFLSLYISKEYIFCGINIFVSIEINSLFGIFCLLFISSKILNFIPFSSNFFLNIIFVGKSIKILDLSVIWEFTIKSNFFSNLFKTVSKSVFVSIDRTFLSFSSFINRTFSFKIK